jgi:hypothetical protein
MLRRPRSGYFLAYLWPRAAQQGLVPPMQYARPRFEWAGLLAKRRRHREPPVYILVSRRSDPLVDYDETVPQNPLAEQCHRA